MDGSLSRDGEKDMRSLAEIREAEAQPGVAEFLEIIEETPDTLKLCIHNRDSKGKKQEIICIGVVLLIIPTTSIFTPFMSPGNPVLPVAIVSVFVSILIACGINDALVRRVIFVDGASGMMRAKGHPFFAREEFQLDRIKSIGIKHEYWHKYTDATRMTYIVISTRDDNLIPAAVKSYVLFNMTFNEKVADAVASRLNYTIKLFRKHKQV